jgi:hypothetical protein
MTRMPSWADFKRISIDVETKDPDLEEAGTWRLASRRITSAASVSPSRTGRGALPAVPPRGRRQPGRERTCIGVPAASNAKALRGARSSAPTSTYDLGLPVEREDRISPGPVVPRRAEWQPCSCNELYDRYGLSAIAERRDLPRARTTSGPRGVRQAAYKCHPKTRACTRLPGRAAARTASRTCGCR